MQAWSQVLSLFFHSTDFHWRFENQLRSWVWLSALRLLTTLHSSPVITDVPSFVHPTSLFCHLSSPQTPLIKSAMHQWCFLRSPPPLPVSQQSAPPPCLSYTDGCIRSRLMSHLSFGLPDLMRRKRPASTSALLQLPHVAIPLFHLICNEVQRH